MHVHVEFCISASEISETFVNLSVAKLLSVEHPSGKVSGVHLLSSRSLETVSPLEMCS